MFFKKRIFPKDEILPWGASISHSVSTTREGAKTFQIHTFRVPHYFSGKSGIELVTPDIRTNAENRVSIKREGGSELGVTICVSLRDPQAHDVVFFSGGVAGYQNDQRSVAFIYRSDDRWHRLDGYPKAIAPAYQNPDGSRFTFSAKNGVPLLVVFVKTHAFNFGEERVLDPRWSQADYLPLSVEGVLNYIGGKLHFHDIWNLSQRNVRAKLDEHERKLANKEIEVARLRAIGIRFADAIWDARSVSGSEKFAIPRRKFESMLGLQRIEKGHGKGQLVPLAKKDAADTQLPPEGRIVEGANFHREGVSHISIPALHKIGG